MEGGGGEKVSSGLQLLPFRVSPQVLLLPLPQSLLLSQLSGLASLPSLGACFSSLA